jgi:ribosomal protein S18 acetylase RimI-like enzyme
MPDGIEFKYHPDYPYDLHGHRRGPTAYAVKNYDQIGHVTWKPDGEVEMIQVDPDYQRHGIATALFDYAKQYEPNLHHSPWKSDLGEAWSSYEKSRTAMPAPLPQGIHFKPFDRGDEISQQLGWKHPNVSHQIGPGVAAYLPGNHVPVGHIEWLDDRDADVAEQFGEPPINPGEVSYINVDDPLRRQSIGTALFDHAQAHEPRVHHSDDRTELGKRWVNHEQSRNSVTAAVTQDLVSRLHDEFHDWWDKNGEEPDDIFGEGGEDEDGYGGDPNAYATRGPIGHWPNIENFLKERYPAAHKDLGAGLEEAASGLDGRWVGDEYETGPEAEARHGYDPKEVAASMLLLHNDSHPLRGHLADEDQARLNDIAQKRYQMQRTYEQRQTTAGLHGDLPENITFQHHSDDTPPFPDVIDPRMTVWASDSGTVSAHDGDKMIGYMRWRTDNHPRRKGEIKEIRVHPDYQRRGVGTAMFDWVTDKIDPDLKHSNNLSDEGRAFADAEDARPLAQERYEAWRNGQPMPKRFAMPMRDAYDWMISDSKRIDDNIPERGTFYHGTDHEHQPGDILTSVRSRHEQDPEANQERMDYYTKSIGAPNHADWVWMYNHPAPATKYMKHVYEVEPLDEGPWIWNNMFGDDGVARPPESDQDFPRLVSPRVRVVRKLSPDEHAAANTHLRDHYRALHSKTSAFRLAMAWDTWAPHINGGCKGICAPGDMTMGEYSIDHTDGSGPQPSDLMPGIKGRSLLQFTHDTDQHGNPEIYVSGIHVDEGHRRDGIAEALMRRMRQDHPDTPINPGFTTDDGQGLLDGLKKRIPGAGDALVPRHAAVNRKLVNRLYSEFHDWWGTNKDDLYFTERNNGGMGPLGHWPNIEAFLADHYPAAHRNLDMGMEAAQPLMDGKGLYGDRVPDAPTYETGQAAVDLHGYDPKEIAASMLLLHNGVNPQRGDMAQHDQDRLNDIFDKRVKMQRTHEQRRPTAGRNGDPPPMTFEPFNTMWSNGIMARHAEDGRPIAHLHWHPDGEIETIRVHPELQGRDIAKHVLAHAVTHPETFEARQGIKPSNNLTNAGRAFARSLGHDPSDEEIDPADDDVTNWGWTAVDNYTPMHIPYTGQNEDEMSHHLDKPWTPPERTAATHGDDWPVWWRGRTHPDVPWDKRWHPNHPQHVPGPWDQ